MQLRHSFSPPDNVRLAHLCGPLDEHLRTIEVAFSVTLHRRGEQFRIEGARGVPQQVVTLLDSLYARADRPLSAELVQLAVASAMRQSTPTTHRRRVGAAAVDDVAAADAALDGDGPDGPQLHTRRADLQGRTPNQVAYLRHILSHDLSFGIGPAGTGKTFLAVACAVDALERSAVQRIVLTRPAVEAGERLGFLPGDLTQKVDPYLRPLYDALYDLMGFDRVTKAFEKGLIEIAPLAFMRGRTLNHAFIILDEAQNTTPEQMKMFLTRIGFGSRAVVTGDVSQIDLPRGSKSGLIEAERILKRVKGVAFTRFTATDVVRHPLVQRIVEAYDAAQLSAASSASSASPAHDGEPHAGLPPIGTAPAPAAAPMDLGPHHRHPRVPSVGPSAPASPAAPVDARAALPPAAARTRIDTRHAGLFFMLNIALSLGLYGDFTQPQAPGLPLSPWQFLRATGQALGGPAVRADPLFNWLIAMDPSPPPRTPLPAGWRPPPGCPVALAQPLAAPASLRVLWPLVRARLALALGLPPTQAVATTLHLPAQVRARAGRVDVCASLAHLPLSVRLAGLDRDPGWLPAAGCDIRFHFEGCTP